MKILLHTLTGIVDSKRTMNTRPDLMRKWKPSDGYLKVNEMFTTQHYKKIAEIVKENLDESSVRDFAYALSDVLELNNPLFDREKFLEACGIR